ncbi:MAG: methyltransferase domain-containing protein [Actinobacteria bacterium]|nr:methyltransferase domain-containing protein [Actinomycetota bacterium]
MRALHLEHFTPGCPVCRSGHLAPVQDTDLSGDGVLACDMDACGARHPLLHGVPVIVADLSGVVENQVLNLVHPDAIDTDVAVLLGDAGGPGSPLDARRQNLSTYTWGHWGDLDPAGDGPKEASVLALLERGLEVTRGTGREVSGPALDLGAGLGRTSLRLAEATGEAVLGIELNVSFARAAMLIIDTGHVAYDLRVTGTRYERRSFDVPVEHSELVDIWVADVAVLPVQAERFGLITSLNLVDCIQHPYTHLQALHDLLQPGGVAIVSSPYDWAPNATDPAHWLGGRPGPEQDGDSPTVLRRLLSGEGPDAIAGLRLLDEVPDLPWDVRLHARSTMRYRVDLFVVERTD